MALRIYFAYAQREPGEANWSILVPDFPEIASVAERKEDWAPQAFDAIATALEARRADGEPIPEASPMREITKDWPAPIPDYPFGIAVEVELPPSQPVRVNVSLDEVLLKRIDAAAARRGMTRSGFLAEGASRLLQDGART